jgi:hypothetical protein
MNRNKILIAAVCGPCLALGGTVVTPALAAQPQPMTLQCDGHDLSVRVNNNNSKEHGGWGAAVVIDGGAGVIVPTYFSGQAIDVTLGTELFSFTQTKGDGNGNHAQATINCTTTQTMSLGDFVDSPDQIPPGASPDDVVSFTITVEAVPHF